MADLSGVVFYALNAWQHGKGKPTFLPEYDPVKEGTLDQMMQALEDKLRENPKALQEGLNRG